MQAARGPWESKLVSLMDRMMCVPVRGGALDADSLEGLAPAKQVPRELEYALAFSRAGGGGSGPKGESSAELVALLHGDQYGAEMQLARRAVAGRVRSTGAAKCDARKDVRRALSETVAAGIEVQLAAKEAMAPMVAARMKAVLM